MQAREKIRQLIVGAAWMIGLSAALQLIEAMLGPANLGGVIFGALVVDLATTRAGVKWDLDAGPRQAPPQGPAPNHAARLVAGGLVALVAVAVVASICVGAGWAVIAGHTAPQVALLFAVVRAVSVSVRDELLLRGLPLVVAARAKVPPVFARVFSALASGATVVLVPGASAAGVALATASGWLFACLWQHERGAWSAVAAHTVWVLLVGSALHGGLLDLEWARGELAIGVAASGPPAWLGATVLVAASAWVMQRSPSVAASR